MPSVHDFLPGVHRSPNIQTDPNIYEIENRAVDQQGLIERAMREIASWEGRIVADMGCGTGYYLPLFHDEAAHVFGVEPHDESRLKAMARVADLGLQKASVLTGSAEQSLFRDHAIGIYHSRFAYFWPPNCAGGIRELDRIMHPGGTAFIIDNDYRDGEFASWLQQIKGNKWLPQGEQERFWASFGFHSRKVESEWQFDSRQDLEKVVMLEFGKKLGESILSTQLGTRVEYVFRLYHREF